MVKQVTGAFRMAPQGALLHFMHMIPMKHFIEKLTYTSALRLYRLPQASQLLRRLGPDWYVLGQGDLPLLVPRSRVLPGKRNQCPTALEALALKVPSKGPRVDVVAIAPWEVPNWVTGTELTQFNADTYVLARVAEVLAQCYTAVTVGWP
jgi:hypothetical protein